MEVFDVAVIGAGLIGSSVAKYVSVLTPKAVLIGPTEGQTEVCHGAWFDQGRLAHLFTQKEVWQRLGECKKSSFFVPSLVESFSLSSSCSSFQRLNPFRGTDKLKKTLELASSRKLGCCP